MKYCTKCGWQMKDDMMFCQKCGTEVENAVQAVQETPPNEPQYTPKYPEQCVVPPKQKSRRVLNGISVFCLFGATVMLLVGIAIDPTPIIGGLIYGILGVMFLLLSKTPKGSTYLFGKEKGVKVLHFVLICIFVLFASVIIFSATQCQHKYTLTDTKMATCAENGKETYICELCKHKKYETLKATGHTIENGKCFVCGYVEAKQDNNSTKKSNNKITMADVKKWYESQISAVSQALIEYAKAVDGLTVLNVNSSRFRFGEDSGWYDCHYTFAFTCVVDGVSYPGEARAFMKYNDNTVNWFHFEIFSNNSATSLVEHYDDSYDKIIEDYYKELERTYAFQNRTMAQPEPQSEPQPVDNLTTDSNDNEYSDDDLYYMTKSAEREWLDGLTSQEIDIDDSESVTAERNWEGMLN